MNGMQTLPSGEVLDLPTAKTLQQGIHKVHEDSLDKYYLKISFVWIQSKETIIHFIEITTTVDHD